MDLHSPTLLWHYTNWRGFEGIVDKHALWASDARYLNDTQELNFALDLLRENLPGMGVPHAICDELIALAPVVTTEVAVVSFSESIDDLSQWRAYGDPAPGFAIGFEERRLVEIAKPLNFSLRPCVYEPQDQLAYARDFAADVLRQFDAVRVETPAATTLGRGRALRRIVNWLERAPDLKHAKFANERERRLVCRTVNELSPAWTAHASRSLVVPHYNLDLEDKAQSPIRAVMVGPSAHPELIAESVAKFLQSKQLPVPVYPSEVPLRNW